MPVKRFFDLLVASFVLLITSPLLAVVWLVVRLRLGKPAIFRQTRPGYLARPFTLYKFRTMTTERDADGHLLPDGRRLTKLGRFLRTTSLDELPELVNVLRGEMSLVGPRPLLMEYVELYSTEQRRRHDMPPGLTGPVQISGRNALSWEQKFALDTEYVDRYSFRNDLKILVLSVWKVLSREGISAQGHETMPRFEGETTNREVLE
jgi:lipopolysaccharide/colanic/teichoic acid biosynthesis glycosyltransferase